MPSDPALVVLHAQVVAIRGIVERLALQDTARRHSLASLEHRVMQHAERLAQIAQTLAALHDLLERGGHH